MRVTALAVLSVLCVATAQAQPKTAAIVRTPVIKQAALTARDLSEVESLLKGMNPSSYNIVISQSGKSTVRMGSAALRDLSTVSVFHAAGARPSAANEIATSVDNYIKVVWTSSVAGADRARMEKVNAILSRTAN